MTIEHAAVQAGSGRMPERLTGEAVFDASGQESEPSAAMVFDQAVPVPTLLVQRELNYLKWLASRTEGSGRVVELGCFLGGSTAALIAGLSESGRVDERILTYDSFETVYDERARFTSWLDAFGIEPGKPFRDRFDRFNAAWLDRLVVREGWLPEDATPQQEREAYPEQEPIELLFIDIAKTWGVDLTVLRAFGRHLRPGSIVVQQDFFDLQTPWIPLHLWQLRGVLEPLDALHGTPSLGLRCTGEVGAALDGLWSADEMRSRDSRSGAWSEVEAYWGGLIGEEAAGFIGGHAAMHALMVGDTDDAAVWGRRYEAWSRSSASRGIYFAPAWPELMETISGELAASGRPSGAIALLAAESVARGSRLDRVRAGEQTNYCPIRQRRDVWEGVCERLSDGGHTRVALFGAGKHTKWLLSESLLQTRGLEVGVIIDDSPASDEICGVQVVASDGFSPSGAGITAVLPSSDSFEARLLTRIHELFGASGIEVVRAYSEAGVSEIARQPNWEYTVDTALATRTGARGAGASVDRASSARLGLGLDQDRPWAGALAGRLRVPDWCTGHVLPNEAAFIWDVVEATRPEKIVEIGTASGVSTAVLLGASDEFCSADATVASFDVAAHCYFDRSRPLASAIAELAPELIGRARLFARANAVDAASFYGIGEVDLAFIDGDHGHPAPAIDVISLLYAFRPGAWVVLHDVELGNFTEEGDGAAWEGSTGAGRLFDAWPFGKVQPEAALPSGRNIGAIRIPETPADALPHLLSLLSGPYESQNASMVDARRASAILESLGS